MTYRTTEGEAWGADGLDRDASNPPSTRIAMKLAREADVRVDELAPLAESIDPEALDDIFEHRAAPDAHVTFTHEGYSITVTGDGSVLVDAIQHR